MRKVPGKWRKLGKIFDPAEHRLPNGCVYFAQSPQAIVFDDFVRIYFSTRATDDVGGKFRSHVAFVDMDKRFSRIRQVANHTVIPLGGLGTFDEHGIFPLSPVRVGDSIYAYTTGWSRRVSVSVETAIGLVVSNDNGETFDRVGTGPVLSASLHEPCLVGDGFVVRTSSHFHMWYIYGTGWRRYQQGEAADRTYKIGHAISGNGIDWERGHGKQIVPDRLGKDECQALPGVIAIDDVYHMFFCYRESFDFRTNRSRGYRIGHAYSDDLQSWTRDDESLALEPGREGDWDSDMLCYPNVFSCEGQVYLLYNGNGFGRQGFGIAVLER